MTIKLATIEPDKAIKEIGDFIIDTMRQRCKTGGVIGLSGGVDSTLVAALAKQAFRKTDYELKAYILPTRINAKADTLTGVDVAERLNIPYKIISLDKIVKANQKIMPEVQYSAFEKGNMISRIRANVLATYAALENKLVLGTGNRDEDFSIGYYTLFGDGAVHLSPIGELPKRLVRELATYMGYADIAEKEPTAGLEQGQTDYKDIGYDYSFVELVTEGLLQGLTLPELEKEPQIAQAAQGQMARWEWIYADPRWHSERQIIGDVLRRHEIAKGKMEIIHPPTAPVTLKYD